MRFTIRLRCESFQRDKRRELRRLSRAGRGDRREPIFRDHADRQSLECGIETLAEARAKTGWLHASLDFKVYDALEDLKRTPDDTLLYAGRDVG